MRAAWTGSLGAAAVAPDAEIAEAAPPVAAPDCSPADAVVPLWEADVPVAATASFVDREEESPEVVAAREEGVPVLGRDEAGLRTLAQILGQDTPLVARSELGLPADLVLAANGAISGAGLTYPSLDTLLTARGLGHLDAWGQVRIGDRLGPTLAEALDEVNREIVREYAQAPRGHRSAKH